MKNFMVKKANDLNVGETFGILIAYWALCLGLMWIVMEFETVTDKIKAVWRKIKNFFKRIKVKLVG